MDAESQTRIQRFFHRADSHRCVDSIKHTGMQGSHARLQDA